MSSPEPEVGSTANSYAILAKLATGGMAELFLARNASAAGVERYVVLKRILRHRAGDAELVQMFLDEARLAAQLQHPNIAQVYDTGVLGDSHFFTMEYVHGESVRELLARAYDAKRALPIGVVLAIVAGAAAGLHHAHERRGLDGKPLGIVHRDVSPSNLMVSYEGNVKVVDFGVAKAASRGTETQTGTVRGKITYLSPEQCRGRAIDRRSDLFSLGIVMWELLVGDRLFKRGSDYENMEAIVKEPTTLPSRRRPDVPADVEAIAMKLLAKAPGERYQTAAALLEDIEQLAMRAAIPLSAASVARFVRELFGQRVEPWVAMQPAGEVTVTADPAVVTVTAEPTVVTATPEWAVGGLADLDLLLANVPDLSSHRVAIEPVATPRRSRRLWGLAALGGALAIAGVVGGALHDRDHESVRADSVPAPAVVAPAPVSTPTPEAARARALEPEPAPESESASEPAAESAPAAASQTRKPKPVHKAKPKPAATKPKPRNCDDDPLSCRR